MQLCFLDRRKVLVGQEEDSRIFKGMKLHLYEAGKTLQTEKEKVYKIFLFVERVDGDKLSILFCNARMREQQMKLAGARQKTKQRSRSLVPQVVPQE